MITLKVEDYCANCPEFEADVEKRDEVYTCFDPSCYGEYKGIEKHQCNTYIYCKHRGRCRAIYNHAKEEVKKG